MLPGLFFVQERSAGSEKIPGNIAELQVNQQEFCV